MTQATMRVAIADDHRLMLDGIKRALESAPDITVVGEAMSGAEMLRLIPECAPDVVLLDLRMPNGDGLDTLTKIRERHSSIKVIILSMFEDPDHVDQALRQGADGYVVKSINPLDLPSMIRQVVEGTTVHLPPRRRAESPDGRGEGVTRVMPPPARPISPTGNSTS